jgi:hypothetical protein
MFSQFLLKGGSLRELLGRFALDCESDFVVNTDDVNLGSRSVVSTRKSQYSAACS